MSQPNSLYNFIYEMKKDDIVVIPLSLTTTAPKTYYVVEITEDLLLKPNFLPDQNLKCKENIGFLRFCEIVAVVKDKNIPRIFTEENTSTFTTKLIEKDEFKKATSDIIAKFPYKR